MQASVLNCCQLQIHRPVVEKHPDKQPGISQHRQHRKGGQKIAERAEQEHGQPVQRR